MRTVSKTEIAGLALLLIAGLFVAPAVPTRLEDWPALRTEIFFQGMTAEWPIAPGDGPLALLLQPMFGTGHVLIHIIAEFCAAIFLTLAVLSASMGLSRRTRFGAIFAVIIASALLREAGLWTAAGLIALSVRRSDDFPAGPLVLGVGLGLFGLLGIHFWFWGIALIALQLISARGFEKSAGACLAGWLGITLAGWNIIPHGLSGLGNFLHAGSQALLENPVWQWAIAALLAGAAGWLAWKSKASAAALLTAAFALASIPLQPETFRQVGQNLGLTAAAHGRAWSILVHPERFDKRVLSPAWKQLASAHPLPIIKEELGIAGVDVAGPAQLIAIANGLLHLPGSRFAGARAIITAADAASVPGMSKTAYRRLIVENDFALFTSAQPGYSGSSPWSLSKMTAYTYLPASIESTGLPRPDSDHNRRIAAFTLPAHLVFGPVPLASRRVVCRYYVEGAATHLLVHYQQNDGARQLLMERYLNPDATPTDRPIQYFTVDLPENATGWVEVTAETTGGGDARRNLRLVDLDFIRDLTHMVSTTLTPKPLHDSGGFMAMPFEVFSATEASPIHADGNPPLLMIHMPATLSFAKPREMARFTGSFGFMPGAYANPDAGTNGATFNIRWFSGAEGARQLFSRTLKPKTEPADRGPQSFNLDVSGLPDGLLEISVSPAIFKDISWGWTYVSSIDLRPADEHRPVHERMAEIYAAYEVGLRPLPGLLKTNEQKPQIIKAGDTSLLRVHAPGEAVLGVASGRTRVTGQFGFADEAWRKKGQTDGADFVVLWRDQKGEVELFRHRLEPDTRPADRGIHPFSVDITGRTNGLVVLRTEPGPKNNNYWDWTGWADVTVR